MTDTPRISVGQIHAPQRLLAGCLLASVILHVLALVWLPGWVRPAVSSTVPVLEVVITAAETPAVVAESLPAAPAPAMPQRRTESRQRILPTLRADPPPQIAAAPAVVEAPAAIAHSEPSRVIETRTPVAEPKAAVASVEPSVTPPLFNASYLRNPAPSYPAAARRRGDEGTVLLKVMVNPEGMPVRVELDQSSGSRPLDHAALDAVKSWRFVPARRGAQSIEAWVRVPVVFRLES